MQLFRCISWALLLQASPYEGSIGPSEYLKIVTGIVMLIGYDNVIPQEFTTAQNERTIIKQNQLKQGEKLDADSIYDSNRYSLTGLPNHLKS